MAMTVDDILNGVGAQQPPVSEKTASANGGNDMQASLADLYSHMFPTDRTVQKTASMNKTAEELRMEQFGKVAGASFNQFMGDFLMKFAEADVATSPVQMPNNRPADAAAPISTAVQYADSQVQPSIAAEAFANMVGGGYGMTDMRQGGAIQTGFEQPAAQLVR